MSLFNALEILPEDPILGLTPLFNADPRPNKINLGVGSYKDDQGRPVVLKAVQQAEKTILEQNLNKEYLPIDGDSTLRHELLKLILGENSPLIKNNQTYSAQTIGASGALRIGAEFLRQIGIGTVALSNPTWSNHIALMERGGLKTCFYDYYNKEENILDFDKLYESLKKLPKKSAVLLHACCHNPTGMDPTSEQWEELSRLIKSLNLVPFFDFAYQGFDQGFDEDAYGVRTFVKDGHEFLIAYSFSKNFGLYGERVGGLCFVGHDSRVIEKIQTNIKVIIRGNYSNPPLQGSRIIKTILTTPELKTEWLKELSEMRDRLKKIRGELLGRIATFQNIKNFEFLKKQKGMFGFLGLEKEQVHLLRHKHGIYMPDSGRISFPGLNSDNLENFINALKDT